VTQYKGQAMLHDLPAWQHFGEKVSGHVIGKAIGQQDFSTLNSVTDEMESNVNVFRSCMVIVSLGKSECSLIVTEQSSCFHGEVG
jgi:hypothetical protein